MVLSLAFLVEEEGRGKLYRQTHCPFESLESFCCGEHSLGNTLERHSMSLEGEYLSLDQDLPVEKNDSTEICYLPCLAFAASLDDSFTFVNGITC